MSTGCTDNLALQQGVSAGYSWPIVDANEKPVDLQGWTARCQVRQIERNGDILLAELSASVVASNVVVQWAAVESMNWLWRTGFCDVLLIDPDNTPRLVVWSGGVKVIPVISRG